MSSVTLKGISNSSDGLIVAYFDLIVRTTEIKTATEGQTIFTISETATDNLAKVTSAVLGVLTQNTDYTVNGTTITYIGSTPITNEDTLTINYYTGSGEPDDREWSDIVNAGSSDIQTVITAKISEYLAEVERQAAIWDAASGDFTFKDMFGNDVVRHIEKSDYIKPLGYSWDTLRVKRNILLTECDWTQIADSPLTNEQKAAYAVYRQALRDLPETYASDITSVVWPTKPA